MKRWPLITTFVLFIALCVSAAYWAMQWFKPPLRPVVAPPQAIQPAARLEAAASLFGGRPVVAVASNFQLRGVVVANNMTESVAILAVDGKPARAVSVNAEVVPGVKVAEVHTHYVLLWDNGSIRRIELPEDVKRRVKVGAPDASHRKNTTAVRIGS
ncbi:MAG: type II secretion system protein N [Gallionella sp.]|nr:type II secretion system protein N [Gallionella sp.]